MSCLLMHVSFLWPSEAIVASALWLEFLLFMLAQHAHLNSCSRTGGPLVSSTYIQYLLQNSGEGPAFDDAGGGAVVVSPLPPLIITIIIIKKKKEQLCPVLVQPKRCSLFFLPPSLSPP